MATPGMTTAEVMRIPTNVHGHSAQHTVANGSLAHMKLGGMDYLIQQNRENANSGNRCFIVDSRRQAAGIWKLAVRHTAVGEKSEIAVPAGTQTIQYLIRRNKTAVNAGAECMEKVRPEARTADRSCRGEICIDD